MVHTVIVNNRGEEKSLCEMNMPEGYNDFQDIHLYYNAAAIFAVNKSMSQA